MNSGLALAESAPSVSPWKPCSAESTRERPVAARPSLIAASTDSAPELVKRTRSTEAGARRSSSSASSAGSDVDAELDRSGPLELERLDERLADTRVVAADVEHAEAAEQVEIAVAVVVPEVRALRAGPAAVEADRPQQLHELRVDRLRVQVERLGAPFLDELAQPAHALDYRDAPMRTPPATIRIAPATSRRPTSSVRRSSSAEKATPQSDSVATSGATTLTRPR